MGQGILAHLMEFYGVGGGGGGGGWGGVNLCQLSLSCSPAVYEIRKSTHETDKNVTSK